MPAALAADAAAGKTKQLIAVLQSGAPIFDQARACQQLGEIGDAQAVPALAALLADEHLSAYARSGLEGIPDPSAAQALRDALATLKGSQLLGAIESLGVRRDANAIESLRKLADDATPGVRPAAWLALGRISTVESIAILRQALATAPEAQRADAAAACLLAAEKQSANGQTAAAVALYDAVRGSSVPPLYRAAAVRGAIVTRNSDGVSLLVEQLRSPDRLFRNAALAAVREIPSDALAEALNAELIRAYTELVRVEGELQVQLLLALADCHNAASPAAILRVTESPNAEVRQTALMVLGRIGGVAEAEFLVGVIARPLGPADAGVALNSLKQMEGAAVDAVLAEALATAAAPAQRIQLIRLLESRGATNVTTILCELTRDADAKVGVAAYRALQSVAGSADLPTLIRVAKAANDASVREAAENAIIGVCTRTGSAGQGSGLALAELQRTDSPEATNSWIRILVGLGQAPALPTILGAGRSANESVAANALERLASWPNPAPVEALLAIARTSGSASGQRALASAIRLATVAADERQSPAPTLVQWLEQANQMATSAQERRLIISALGRLADGGSLRLLAPYLDDAELQSEAGLAILQIAPALRQTDPAALKPVLEKIASSANSPELRAKAGQMARSIPDGTK